MGVDLTLLPLDSAQDTWQWATTVLPLDTASDLFDAILAIESKPAPAELETYFKRSDDPDEDMARTTVDSYGDPLRCVTVGQLIRLSRHSGVHISARNKAVWSYLRALKSHQTPVVLYWD